MAIGDDGRWAAPTIGAEIPRQQGKSEGLNLARISYGLVVLRENIAFTSHRSDAEREFFEALKRFLCQPCFKRYVTEDDFRAAVGREALELKAGNKIEFMARSNKSGRSKHADLVVFDEAQFLTSSQKASILPTTLTRSNMQTISTGTPPEFDDDGSEFRRLRERGQKGEQFVCYDEWSLPKMPEDVADRDVWYMVMPSLGHIIQERNVEILLGDMEPQDFARELLGVWTSGRVSDPPAISAEEWAECEIESAPKKAKDERVACGIKFSADGSTYSVSMAARSKKKGYAHIECVDRTGTARGVSGLAEWLCNRKDRLAVVCIDGRAWAPTLIQRLNDSGFPKKAIHEMKSREVCDACGMLAAAVEERTVTHIAQPILTDSATKSPPRAVGRDGWAFGGDDPTPVESSALALWGALTTNRDPKRKLRLSV